jgi:hypothetical protein
MRFLQIATLIVAISLTAAAESEQPAPKLSQAEDPFAFAQAFVDSLGDAWVGLKRIDPDPPNKPPSDFAELMYQTKMSSGDFLKASVTMKPFANSRNEAIQVSASGACMIYEGQRELNKQAVDKLKAFLDDSSETKYGSLLEWTSDIRAKRDQLWKLLFSTVTPSATFGLATLPEKPDPSRARLSITTDQRIVILRSIEKMFGVGIKTGPKAGDDYVKASAGGLYKFLAGEGWKASDEK